MIDWSTVFAEAISYGKFLDRYATASQRARWDAMHGRLSLTAEQSALWAVLTLMGSTGLIGAVAGIRKVAGKNEFL